MYRIMKQILTGDKGHHTGRLTASPKLSEMYTHAITWQEQETQEQQSTKFSATLLEPDVWRIEKWHWENDKWINLGTVRGSSKMSTRMALRMLEILETNEARKRGVNVFQKKSFEGYYKIEEKKMIAKDRSTVLSHTENPLH